MAPLVDTPMENIPNIQRFMQKKNQTGLIIRRGPGKKNITIPGIAQWNTKKATWFVLTCTGVIPYRDARPVKYPSNKRDLTR